MPKIMNFKGAASRGLGLSFLPRSIIEVESYGTNLNGKTAKQGLDCTVLYHRVVRSWVADETGLLPKEPDNSLVGMTFEHQMLDVGLEGASEKANEIREKDLKNAMIAHGGPREQIDAIKGQFAIEERFFDGRRAFIRYDPPAADAQGGDDSYPDVFYIRPADVNEYISGSKRVSWPKDRRSTRASANVAVGGGTAGGQFLTGQRAAVPDALAAAAKPPTLPAAAAPSNGAGAAVSSFLGGSQPAPAGGQTPPSW